jgi:hypothetical protein
MTRISKITNVRETSLWLALSAQRSEDAQVLAPNVASLCVEASDRMKAMYAYAPQYTLHDDQHLLRTTELMGLILGDQVARLNAIELSLLILSAFFHDQGMVLTAGEYASLAEDADYQLFKNNWMLEHPNYGETAAQLSKIELTTDRKTQLAKHIAELDTALLTDYVRVKHGNRVADFIRSTYGHDKRIEIQKTNLASLLGKLCESHTLSGDMLKPERGFQYDERLGTYAINMPFLAVVLRLADILDFDRDRTPEVLLKSIHFTSPISLHEWEKHRSVAGWEITRELIRFTVKCAHPAYEASTRKYMDWIDSELSTAIEICRKQPRDINGYELNIPTHVDRSRIAPLDESYRSHDLEFSLSRDEVVRLLMTDKLYGSEHLCIRELLQNSLDALRYRKALFADAGSGWSEGRVEFSHFVNQDGNEVLECKDNGSGMDEEIIRNHFVKVGRSFYRSPVFEREMNRLKATGNSFDPCSQFGIGFMSCFMLGDRITIKTRRDYGAGHDWGTPLLVEIHGLSGLLVVRKGDANQPIGTTVTIVSRQRPSFIDPWTDKIRLCTVLKGYALATEFPIDASCTVPEIKETLSIPASYEQIPTLLEVAQVNSRICFEQDLLEISPSLNGFVRDAILADNTGLPCLANAEAEWIGRNTSATQKEWHLQLCSGDRKFDYDHEKGMGLRVCMDGILIAGTPGRPSSGKRIRMRLGDRNSQIYSSSPALIDARSDLKPEITPSRTPPENFGINLPPGWRRLDNAFRKGLGRMWGKLTDYIPQGLSPEIFWKLSVVHDIPVEWIPSNKLWETLSTSLIAKDGSTSWCLARELGSMSMSASENGFVLSDSQGQIVGPDSALSRWEQQGEERPHLAWRMNSITLLMSCLDVRDGRVVITPLPPTRSDAPLAPFAYIASIGVSMFLIDYVGNAGDLLSAQTPYPTANRNHPLAKLAQQSRDASVSSDLEDFARSFVQCISETLSTKNETPSLDKPGYWHKRVGHLFFSVRWDQYDKSLAPPYKLWSKEGGFFSFGTDDFAQWRDSSESLD